MTTEELHEIVEQIKNIKSHPQTLTTINMCEVAKQSYTLKGIKLARVNPSTLLRTDGKIQLGALYIPAGKSCFWAGATAKMKAVFI